MYLLFQDINCSNDDAPYIFCRIVTPVTYQWRIDFLNPDNITAHHTDDGNHLPFTTLHGLIEFYTKRDNASFKLIARGKTISRLFERYPELLI